MLYLKVVTWGTCRIMTSRMSYQPSQVAKAAYVAASNGLSMGPPPGAKNKRDTRFSVAALWSMAAENDAEVDDELTRSEMD